MCVSLISTWEFHPVPASGLVQLRLHAAYVCFTKVECVECLVYTVRSNELSLVLEQFPCAPLIVIMVMLFVAIMELGQQYVPLLLDKPFASPPQYTLPSSSLLPFPIYILILLVVVLVIIYRFLIQLIRILQY